MLDSLFNIKISWAALFVMMFAIYLIFPDIGFLSLLALFISLHQILLLFFSLGSVIPIRFILGALMCLQMLIGPTFAYGGLDKYQFVGYRMQVPEEVYFSYAIPAVVCFIIGMHLFSNNLKGEVLNVKKINRFIGFATSFPYFFIAIGFLSSFVATAFSSELALVFYLLSGFKFIGVFLLILSESKIKTVPLIIVIVSIVSSSLAGGGVFHDLLTWGLMIGAIVSIKLKPSVLFKALFTLAFVILVVIIQQLKGTYRAATGSKTEEAGIETFSNLYQKQNEKGAIFGFESLAQSNVRINQGFIVTNIMVTVPDRVPYADGAELYQILEAAFLPRILAPNKLAAGNKKIFYLYSGIPLREGTSMGLSSLGDGYINFGLWGGCVFMFFLGLFYNFLLKKFGEYGEIYPILPLFTTLAFLYSIRPDCELQTSLGHLVKTCILLIIIVFFWKNKLKIRSGKTRDGNALAFAK